MVSSRPPLGFESTQHTLRTALCGPLLFRISGLVSPRPRASATRLPALHAPTSVRARASPAPARAILGRAADAKASAAYPPSQIHSSTHAHQRGPDRSSLTLTNDADLGFSGLFQCRSCQRRGLFVLPAERRTHVAALLHTPNTVGPLGAYIVTRVPKGHSAVARDIANAEAARGGAAARGPLRPHTGFCIGEVEDASDCAPVVSRVTVVGVVCIPRRRVAARYRSCPRAWIQAAPHMRFTRVDFPTACTAISTLSRCATSPVFSA
jgi:hypothetical protein